MNLTHNYQPAIDPVEKAAAAFLAGSDGMFEYMLEASYIVGRKIDGETIRLGKRIRRSPDTVERHAKGGLLFHAIDRTKKVDTEVMREALDYQYWVSLGCLWSKGIVSLEGAVTWLETAVSNKWDYDYFLTQLPKTKQIDSEWQKTARKAALILDDLCASPAFDVDITKYKIGLKLIKTTSNFLKGMTTMNVIEKLIEEKIATNVFQASHIANGLKLIELKTLDEQIKRARLYRDWRNVGEESKTAYQKAIVGEAVPDPMFDGVLHSEEQ